MSKREHRQHPLYTEKEIYTSKKPHTPPTTAWPRDRQNSSHPQQKPHPTSQFLSSHLSYSPSHTLLPTKAATMVSTNEEAPLPRKQTRRLLLGSARIAQEDTSPSNYNAADIRKEGGAKSGEGVDAGLNTGGAATRSQGGGRLEARRGAGLPTRSNNGTQRTRSEGRRRIGFEGDENGQAHDPTGDAAPTTTPAGDLRRQAPPPSHDSDLDM